MTLRNSHQFRKLWSQFPTVHICVQKYQLLNQRFDSKTRNFTKNQNGENGKLIFAKVYRPTWHECINSWSFSKYEKENNLYLFTFDMCNVFVPISRNRSLRKTKVELWSAKKLKTNVVEKNYVFGKSWKDAVVKMKSEFCTQHLYTFIHVTSNMLII